MKKYLIILLALITTLHVWGQFEDEQIILDGSGALQVLAIDLDADGDDDIVTVKDAQGISGHWYENTDGQGTFAKPQVFDYFYAQTGTSSSISKVYAADVNGDGKMDIVCNQRWLENTGDPSSFIAHVLDYNLSEIKIPGDMDADGDMDILVTMAYSPNNGREGGIFWLENIDGLGNFQKLNDFNSDYDNIRNVGAEIFDHDGDGDLDVIAFYDPISSSSFYVVFENTNGNGATMLEVWSSNIDDVWATAKGDINDDGLEDVAVIRKLSNGSTRPSLLLNIGGGFQQTNYNTFVNDQTDLYFANIDNSGAEELLVLSPGTNYVSGDPFTGNLSPTLNPVGGLITAGAASLGDFNGDQFLDLVETYDDFLTLSGSNKDLRIVYNQNGNPSVDEVDIEYFIRSNSKKLVRDFDLDGDNDIILLNGKFPNNQRLELLKNDGVGNFNKEILISDGILQSSEFEIVDVNDDGRNDVIINEGSQVFSFLQNSDGTITKNDSPFFDQSVGLIRTVDVNNDDRSDYIYLWDQDQTIYIQLNNGGQPEPPVGINYTFGGVLEFELADVNFDGSVDIVMYVESEQVTVSYNDGNGNFSTPSLLVSNTGNLIGVADINGDGANDLIFTRSSALIFTDKVTVSYYDISGSSYLPEEDVLEQQNTVEFEVADYDNDGDIDIITNFGVAINVTGEGDFFYSVGTGSLDLFEATQDLNGDGLPDLVNFNVLRSRLSWSENSFNSIAQTSGQVVIDDNDNCEVDPGESFFPGAIIQIEKDGEVHYANSGLQGFYGTLTDDLGDYNFELQLPSPYWTACDIDTTVSITDVNIDYEVDFYLQAEVDCPLLSPELAVTRLRPCIPGRITLSYCNYGTITSELSEATLAIPFGLIVNSASQPIVEQTDSTIVFEIDPIQPGSCGNIFINVTPDCELLEVYDVVCTEVKVTPDELCVPIDLSWDGSTIEATGFCVGDSARFILRNIGDGAMDQPRQFRLSGIINEDIVMNIVDTFDLDPNEEKIITVLNTAVDASRIEAEQDPDHPSANTANALVQNCDGLIEELWSELFFSFPQFNGDPFQDFACKSITSSFDPNEKVAEPTGLGDAHLIEKDWELEYTVYFQNTGNDTAFTVEIIDTLSELLDISTLRINGASHPFVWEINPDNELRFFFDDILLPDSTTDVLGSQGFVEFAITPKQTIPFNALIFNRAGIYFDFNDPIITNFTFHTIRKPVRYSSEHFQVCEGEEIFGQVFESDTIFQESIEFQSYDSIAFQHIHVINDVEKTLNVTVTEGGFYEGVLIQNDTTIIFHDLSIDGCDSTTTVIVDAVVSNINNLNSLKDLKVFPNPTKDDLFIRAEGLDILEIEIYSIVGRVKLKIDHYDQHKFNLSGLPSGVYQLRIQTSGGLATRMITKLE